MFYLRMPMQGTDVERHVGDECPHMSLASLLNVCHAIMSTHVRQLEPREESSEQRANPELHHRAGPHAECLRFILHFDNGEQ